jgi:hypothetical protein
MQQNATKLGRDPQKSGQNQGKMGQNWDGLQPIFLQNQQHPKECRAAFFSHFACCAPQPLERTGLPTGWVKTAAEREKRTRLSRFVRLDKLARFRDAATTAQGGL